MELKERKLEKIDFSKYKLAEKSKRAVNKNQNLALEIIAYCGIDKKMAGRWFRICKKNYQFVEGKFSSFKETGKTSAAYLWRCIHPKKK